VKRIVCLDPGHGGRDPGAVGHGLIEKNVALDITKKVRRILENSGVTVVMTRSADLEQWNELGLQERCDLSNNAMADCFVSIHCNAFTSSEPRGLETFFFRGSYNGAALARSIQTSVRKEAQEMPERRVAGAGFYVLRHTEAPAALVECGFLTNPKDAALLKMDLFRYAQAKGIAAGIMEWLGMETSPCFSDLPAPTAS
jgi:N-acetylmuramoyl-L-alanine amidase